MHLRFDVFPQLTCQQSITVESNHHPSYILSSWCYRKFPGGMFFGRNRSSFSEHAKQSPTSSARDILALTFSCVHRCSFGSRWGSWHRGNRRGKIRGRRRRTRWFFDTNHGRNRVPVWVAARANRVIVPNIDSSCSFCFFRRPNHWKLACRQWRYGWCPTQLTQKKWWVLSYFNFLGYNWKYEIHDECCVKTAQNRLLTSTNKH